MRSHGTNNQFRYFPSFASLPERTFTSPGAPGPYVPKELAPARVTLRRGTLGLHAMESLPGYCEATGYLEGDARPNLLVGGCETGRHDKGSWMLGSLALCLNRCKRCTRCKFVSFSAVESDCSWYTACQLDRLHPSSQGHLTYALHNRGLSSPSAQRWHEKPVPHTSLEFVPAVFREWGAFDAALGHFMHEPRWVASTFPNRTTYQRLEPGKRNFVPNRGFEVGVYLHHIVHRYESLADITVFAQADVHRQVALGAACLRRNVSWAPLASDHHVPYFKRGSDCTTMWTGQPHHAATLQCFADHLSLFGELPPARPLPCPSFYTADNMAVSRSLIRRFPLRVWQRAYRLHVLQNVCHTGAIDLHSELFPQSVADTSTPYDRPDYSYQKNAKGLSTEFTSNVIFGAQTFAMHQWGHSEWCTQYEPGCPHSPCWTE